MDHNAHPYADHDTEDADIITVNHYNVAGITGWIGIVFGSLFLLGHYMGILETKPYVAIFSIACGAFPAFFSGPLMTSRQFFAKEIDADDIE